MSDQPAKPRSPRRGRGESCPPGRPWRFGIFAFLFVIVLPQLESLLIPRALFIYEKLGVELPLFARFTYRLFHGDVQFYRIFWSVIMITTATIFYTKLSESHVRTRFAIMILLFALLYAHLIGSVILFSYFNARSVALSVWGSVPSGV